MGSRSRCAFHKVALLGDSGVGKSTIFSMLFGERFSSCYVKTKERVIKTKDFLLKNGMRQSLQIWDVPGSDEQRTYTTHNIKDVKGVVLVFDVSNEESYHNVANWIKTIQQYVDRDIVDATVIIVVANKVDKTNCRKVKEEQVQQLAHQYNVECIETSAKLGQNIERVFELLAEELGKGTNGQLASQSEEQETSSKEDIFRRFCSLL